MSRALILSTFNNGGVVSRLVLPFKINDIINEWDKLRHIMVKNIPEEFSRDEWAYLITFLEKSKLELHFDKSFGNLVNDNNFPTHIVRPRGKVGLWLPNNVSLLGPLMMVLISLTGNSLHVKKGSNTTDLAGAFLAYLNKHLSSGVLYEYINDQIIVEYFPREDFRQRELSMNSDTRIIFGSDESALAIQALDHKPDSIVFSFVDKKSEAWISPGQATDDTLKQLLRVFSIYGKAGCTSPAKLVLIDHSTEDAFELRNRLCKLAADVLGKVEMYRASENIMSYQWAIANGWDACLTKNNSACFAVGNNCLPVFQGFYSLPITTATLEEASNNLPDNIQTLGIAIDDTYKDKILDLVTNTVIKRVVPISQMHHFSSIWDGFDFWPQLFESVEIAID